MGTLYPQIRVSSVEKVSHENRQEKLTNSDRCALGGFEIHREKMRRYSLTVEIRRAGGKGR